MFIELIVFSDYISKLIIYVLQVLLTAFTSLSLKARSNTSISHSNFRYDRDNELSPKRLMLYLPEYRIVTDKCLPS